MTHDTTSSKKLTTAKSDIGMRDREISWGHISIRGGSFWALPVTSLAVLAGPPDRPVADNRLGKEYRESEKTDPVSSGKGKLFNHRKEIGKRNFKRGREGS